ncbi:MAG: ATP-binding protein [Negativicutes bacterium]|nr:ATP-binding protein [Negativicutes bacterium]
MFQKLRLKLTMVNVSIILTLFLLLITGVYCFMRLDFAKRGDFLAKQIAADITEGRITDLPHKRSPPNTMFDPQAPPSSPPPIPNFFFVKTSPSGTITFRSSGQTLDESDLAVLIKRSLELSQPQGFVKIGQVEYAYLKSSMETPPDILIVFHDLSQEKNMLQTLLIALLGVGMVCSLLSFGASYYMANRAMIPILRAWQQRKDFLSDASHELRTPLTVLQTNLEVIQDSLEETVSSQSKWLDNIHEATIRMAKLVDSLLFLTKADSQLPLLDMRLFLFGAVLEQSVTLFEAIANAKGLSLEVYADLNVEGYGDEDRIKQVIAILLDNAIRHTPSGGKVTVLLSRQGDEILLTVADTGEGIEPEYLTRIFDRFYQVDKTRNKGNSGLGLSIAKWIVENHGGDISAASVPGAGATFTVCLPGSVVR